jgi:glycosyltransferase involved in cell wall biosynthesis
MNKYPKITIVTPCFNHGKFIGETIESILSQGYPNLEYFVINDGSTDNSEEEILKYRKYNFQYEYWKGYRSSPVFALNRAFKNATGDIFGWVSSDDILLKNSLFTVAKVFNELEEVDWFTGMASTINSRGEIVNSRFRPKHKLDFLADNWQVIQQESTFFRKSLWDQSGGYFNEEFEQAFDTELWTRFFIHSVHYNLRTPIGAFRKGNQSRSVQNIEEFLSYNKKAIAFLKNESKGLKNISLYSFLRMKYIKQIMSIIPIGIAKKIFGDMLYNTLNYNFEEDKWLLTKENPFKY